MKCEAAQDWLLQCESLRPKSWPRGVVKHLRVCTTCYQFGKGVKRLERAWRNLPVPEGCEAAKANFLAKLADLKETEKPHPKRDRRAKKLAPPHRPAWGMRWLAVAAALFIGIVGVASLIPRRNTNADVVDRLVEWSVDLAKAEPKERRQMFEEYEGSFRNDLKMAVLAPDERRLGEELLDLDRKLAAADGPLAEAEVVTTIAEKLMSRAAVAWDNGNEQDTERSGIRYGRFSAYADQFNPPEVKSGVEKDKGGIGKDKIGFEKDKPFIDKSKGLPPKVTEKTAIDQKKQFEALYRRSPEFSRPDLHKQFETWGKKGGPPVPSFVPKGKK
jgi:hypothetical protein